MIERLSHERLLLDDALEARFHALADCYQKLDRQDRELIDLRYTEGATIPTFTCCVRMPAPSYSVRFRLNDGVMPAQSS